MDDNPIGENTLSILQELGEIAFVGLVHFRYVVATLAITVSTGLAAASIVIFGDTRRNMGKRNVAEKLAQIAVLVPQPSPHF
jgi:hypothetical protein